LISSMISAGPLAKRPPHIRLLMLTLFLSAAPSTRPATQR